MMIRAYQETYLPNAQSLLGDAFDCAVNQFAIPGKDFIKMFIASSISRRMENGEPEYLLGKSGAELVVDVALETLGRKIEPEFHAMFDTTSEYWAGWAVAYYQWYSNRKYGNIFRVVSFNDLIHMYNTLHEADISKFIDIMETKMREYYKEPNLKRIRSSYGCSQSDLAKYSGVSLRAIQMYEQWRKDINHASAETLLRLSKTLGCSMEDLMETGIRSSSPARR